ncbi:MAG TPA: membrane protein insertase YidC [Proteobacteria bacterium]|nr:membrane protein insertase YidC [Pseudomonadota bacterium]
MEKRTILAIALSVAVLLGFQYLFPTVSEIPQPKTVTSPHATSVAGSEKSSGNPVTEKAAEKDDDPTTAATTLAGAVFSEGRILVVQSSLYRAEINTAGGQLKAFYLKEYREDITADSPDLNLVTVNGSNLYPLSGAVNIKGQWYEDRQRLFETPDDGDRITVSGSGSTLRLQAPLVNGWTLIKNFNFIPNSYLIEIVYEIVDESGNRGSIDGVRLFWSHTNAAQEKKEYVYNGVLGYIEGELYKPSKKENKISRQELMGPVSWLGYTSKYFICALLVPQPEAAAQATGVIERADVRQVNAGLQVNQTDRIKAYLGPKKGTLLQAQGLNLEDSIEYGWFGVIARPLVELLHFFNKYVHNYGLAIIILTILIKLAFYPLSQKSYKSMGKMKEVQPKLAKLKEKFKDDKARLNKEMMDLYRTHKVNPFSGCLPVVVQIPVFFALYRALMVAIELRHAPFLGWIMDLSAKDPYYVTPLIMGATMFLQQKMTPTTGDAMQARMMLFMPVIFTFMFLNFPSGLVLYWLVNNVLSIGQQYMVMRQSAAS